MLTGIFGEGCGWVVDAGEVGTIFDQMSPQKKREILCKLASLGRVVGGWLMLVRSPSLIRCHHRKNVRF